MSNHMHLSHIALAISLGCALGGCVDMAPDDAADTAVVNQAIFHNEVRVRRIKAEVLEEGGDEIYLTASQSSGGSVNIIRPPTIPDYWRFDEPDAFLKMDQHVGTIVPGSLLIVNLREQDAGEHDQIGTIDFELDHHGEPRTFDTPTGHFLGTVGGGAFLVVRFTNGANYLVWFEVGP